MPQRKKKSTQKGKNRSEETNMSDLEEDIVEYYNNKKKSKPNLDEDSLIDELSSLKLKKKVKSEKKKVSCKKKEIPKKSLQIFEKNKKIGKNLDTKKKSLSSDFNEKSITSLFSNSILSDDSTKGSEIKPEKEPINKKEDREKKIKQLKVKLRTPEKSNKKQHLRTILGKKDLEALLNKSIIDSESEVYFSVNKLEADDFNKTLKAKMLRHLKKDKRKYQEDN